MSWPLSSEFNESVQNPQVAFSDPDLKGGETVVGATGLPLPRSGNFADVYQVRGADGRDWAVKCFTRPVVGLAERYAKLSDALARANLPFAVGFTYLAEGIRVGGVWRPIVKMEWVEGRLLHQVARENATKPAVLQALGQMWSKLCKRLREADIAHADVQHGNVLLVPGSRTGAYGLKLIDYDGMWVPALANTPSGESGHPSYQHPARAASRTYSPDVDRFPHLVVATALRGLAVCGSALWEKYDNGDNLLFTEADYKKPAESAVLKELWRTENPAVQAFVGRLAIACGKSIPQTPWLDQFAPEGEPDPLDDATRREAENALGLAPPVPVPLPPEPSEVAEPPSPLVEAILRSEPSRARQGARDAEERSAKRAESDEPRSDRRARKPGGRANGPWSQRGIPVWVWPVAAGVGLLVVVGAVLALRPKPEPTTLVKADPEPTKPIDAPAPRPPVPAPKPKDTITPKPKDKEKEKEKDKEPDPIPVPKQKDPEPPREPVVLKSVWRVSADSDGAPATLRIRDQTILWGGPRTSLGALGLQRGEKYPAFALIELTGGDRFQPLDRGRVARYVPDDTEVRTWDVKTGKPGEKFPVAAVPPGEGAARTKLAWLSPNGKHLAVAQSALTPGANEVAPLRIFLTDKSGKLVVDTNWVGGSVHFTADSSRVLVAEHGGRFRWFDLASGESDAGWNFPKPAPGHAHAVTDITADGRVIGYNGPADAESEAAPCLIDGKTGTVLHRFGAGYVPTAPVALSGDGRVAAVLKELVEGAATVEVVSVPKGEPIARAAVVTKGVVPSFALSDDSRVLLVHDPKAGRLSRFDLPSR